MLNNAIVYFNNKQKQLEFLIKTNIKKHIFFLNINELFAYLRHLKQR